MATKLAQLEARLQKLEVEVREIKGPTADLNGQKPWYDQILGTFDDDPGFDEMVRLGKEIRDQDRGLRPVTRKRAVSRKGGR